MKPWATTIALALLIQMLFIAVTPSGGNDTRIDATSILSQFIEIYSERIVSYDISDIMTSGNLTVTLSPQGIYIEGSGSFTIDLGNPINYTIIVYYANGTYTVVNGTASESSITGKGNPTIILNGEMVLSETAKVVKQIHPRLLLEADGDIYVETSEKIIVKTTLKNPYTVQDNLIRFQYINVNMSDTDWSPLYILSDIIYLYSFTNKSWTSLHGICVVRSPGIYVVIVLRDGYIGFKYVEYNPRHYILYTIYDLGLVNRIEITIGNRTRTIFVDDSELSKPYTTIMVNSTFILVPVYEPQLVSTEKGFSLIIPETGDTLLINNKTYAKFGEIVRSVYLPKPVDYFVDEEGLFGTMIGLSALPITIYHNKYYVGVDPVNIPVKIHVNVPGTYIIEVHGEYVTNTTNVTLVAPSPGRYGITLPVYPVSPGDYPVFFTIKGGNLSLGVGLIVVSVPTIVVEPETTADELIIHAYYRYTDKQTEARIPVAVYIRSANRWVNGTTPLKIPLSSIPESGVYLVFDKYGNQIYSGYVAVPPNYMVYLIIAVMVMILVVAGAYALLMRHEFKETTKKLSEESETIEAIKPTLEDTRNVIRTLRDYAITKLKSPDLPVTLTEAYYLLRGHILVRKAYRILEQRMPGKNRRELEEAAVRAILAGISKIRVRVGSRMAPLLKVFRTADDIYIFTNEWIDHRNAMHQILVRNTIEKLVTVGVQVLPVSQSLQMAGLPDLFIQLGLVNPLIYAVEVENVSNTESPTEIRERIERIMRRYDSLKASKRIDIAGLYIVVPDYAYANFVKAFEKYLMSVLGLSSPDEITTKTNAGKGVISEILHSIKYIPTIKRIVVFGDPNFMDSFLSARFIYPFGIFRLSDLQQFVEHQLLIQLQNEAREMLRVQQ